ncbi:MAG: sigma-70 family RNA polymerase sigma factor [Aquabacterium sp.]|uniref:RNA polymerase sigma factor n=1 Tax=Aquabacterium sp. TaxID=1872578 RepID=UPI0027191D17|nr:sigma-70 family RNA polymerase sigma factor [Aquabacterium sp.]MDO9002945.1 sigma-70 family RNA polymerase sigma factor [Aquabacterium sp.]
MQTLVQDLVRHYDDLRRHLVRELRDADHAADIAQSTFERVYTHALNLPAIHIDSPRAMLFKVARNLCIDEARHRRVAQDWARDKYHADLHCAQPSSEHLFAHRQLLERVVETIERLPPRRREVFLLFRAHGYSHAEIAERLGITEMAVAKHLVRSVIDCSRALAELRTQLLEPQAVSLQGEFGGHLAEDRC